MASFTLSTENFVNFLTSFGNDLMDISIKVEAAAISAAVGKTTHYVSRRMDCGVEKTGYVHITDLPKLKAFLKKAKVSDLRLSQEGNTGTLHVRGGKMSLQLPTAAFVESQKRVGMMQSAIDRSRDSMWQSWFDAPLTHHGRVSSESLKPVTAFKSVLGDQYGCKTEFDADGSEFVVRGGKQSTGKMFVRAPLTQVEAPGSNARSAFDKWLPELLNNLPSGDVDIHTGDETVLIIEQATTQFLMVVIDQQYEED